MSYSPLVSIYITTQNRPELLSRALDSLLAQSYRNFEVLICDDASDDVFMDRYNAIHKKYEASFSRYVYSRNETKMGACFSRNKLIDLAQGEFVTGLDDDDAFHKERLHLFINFISKQKRKYSFVCSGVNSIGNNNDIDVENFSGREITFEDMKNINIVGNQVFVKKEMIQGITGFDTQMPAWQDYDTWFRLIKKYGIAYKLDAMTMLLDTSDSRVRITTSSNAYRGYQCFIKKHKLDLSNENLLSLKYNDLINRKQKFSIFNKELSGHFSLQKRLFKYKSVYDYPVLYKLYQRLLKNK